MLLVGRGMGCVVAQFKSCVMLFMNILTVVLYRENGRSKIMDCIGISE